MPGLGSRSLEKIALNTFKSLVIEADNGSSTRAFYEDLLRQGKKLSQLICYIWYYGDPKRCKGEEYDTAYELDKYFREVEGKKLSDLLFAQPDNEEYSLLKEVFSKQIEKLSEKDILPIFNTKDAQHIRFRVSAEKFEGHLDDPLPTEDKILVMNIPYPPRPEIVIDDYVGYAPIREGEMTNWIENRTYNGIISKAECQEKIAEKQQQIVKLREQTNPNEAEIEQLQKEIEQLPYDARYFPPNYYMPASTC